MNNRLDAFVQTLPLAILALAAAAAVAMSGTTAATTSATPADYAAESNAIIAAQVADMTAGRDCWDPSTASAARNLTATGVLVRNAAGNHRQDVAVVREVTLSAALDASGRGEVYVLRSCH